MRKERLVKTKSSAARALERKLFEFEALVRVHERRNKLTKFDYEEVTKDYEIKRREMQNILRSLVNLAEDGEPL